jgi:hypothetical protein
LIELSNLEYMHDSFHILVGEALLLLLCVSVIIGGFQGYCTSQTQTQAQAQAPAQAQTYSKTQPQTY